MRPIRQEQFDHAVAHATLRLMARRMGRHAALALIGAVTFALATLALIGTSIDAHDELAAQGDPVALSDQALARRFDRTVAEREMEAALAAGDADLARSFLDLARDREVGVDPALADRVTTAGTEAASATHAAGSFVRGLVTGEPHDLVSLAGTALGDLFVFGDIRDATREGVRLATGREADKLILGLACVGLAITAGTYVTLGGGTPVRVGLSLVKAARRTGKLSGRLAEWLGRSLRDAVDSGPLRRAIGLSEPTLVANAAREAVKIDKAGGLVELVGNVGRVEAKAGSQAALDSLAVAEGPRDMSRFARLAAAKGGKTRAIIKLLGRGAIVLTASAFELTMWLFWAAFMLLGFVSSCKTMVERMTLRHLHRRKARRLREAEARAGDGSTVECFGRMSKSVRSVATA